MKKLHISLKLSYNLLHDDISFEWIPELDKRLYHIKTSHSNDVDLAIPDAIHPFHITVDASLNGLVAILFQPDLNKKLQVLSYSSRILTTKTFNL